MKIDHQKMQELMRAGRIIPLTTPHNPAPGDVYESRGEHWVLGKQDTNGFWSCYNFAIGIDYGIARLAPTDFPDRKRLNIRMPDMAARMTFEPIGQAEFSFRGVRIRMCSPELKLQYRTDTHEYCAIRADCRLQIMRELGWDFCNGSAQSVKWAVKLYAADNVFYDRIRTAEAIYTEALHIAAHVAAYSEGREADEDDLRGLPLLAEEPEFAPIHFVEVEAAINVGSAPQTQVSDGATWVPVPRRTDAMDAAAHLSQIIQDTRPERVDIPNMLQGANTIITSADTDPE